MKTNLSFVLISSLLMVQQLSAKGPHQQVHAQQQAEVPVISPGTVKVLQTPVWDYMRWQDATEKKYLRAMLLSIDNDVATMSKLDGTTVKVNLNQFAKEDQELLNRYANKDHISMLVDKEYGILNQDIKYAITVPDDTRVRQDAEIARRHATFLQKHNGQLFMLCFPITDVRQRPKNDLFDYSGRQPNWQEGHYVLQLGCETSHTQGSQASWALAGGGSSAIVRLTPAQASWINKGDKLFARGTTKFEFSSDSTEYRQQRPAPLGTWVFWDGYPGQLRLSLQDVTLSLSREEPDTTLADAVALRVAQFKALQAAEAARASAKAAADTDPFK